MSQILPAFTRNINLLSCRPSSVTLPQTPISLYSDPGGSCLFVAFSSNDSVSLRAYYWSTFGHTDGIDLTFEGLSADSNVIMSIGARNVVYFLTLNEAQRQCNSVALNIKRATADFNLCEQLKEPLGGFPPQRTSRNCFLDCLSDVWSRFPVISTVQRSTSCLSDGNETHLLFFVASSEPNLAQEYLRTLISTFKRNSKKPTSEVLTDMVVCGMSYNAFSKTSNAVVSEHRCGHWLINLLCLVPIHIAVTWNNQFVPLKDGVWSREFDRSLLGATVEQIVDSLSFGWYESIFKSYVGSKVVQNYITV